MLLVDTSHPESLGHYLYQSFTYHQEKPSSSLIKKLLLRSVLHSAPLDTSIDLTDLDRKISVSANTHTHTQIIFSYMHEYDHIYLLSACFKINYACTLSCVCVLKFKGSMSTMSEGGTGAPLLILCFSNDSLLYQYYYFLHSLCHYQQ